MAFMAGLDIAIEVDEAVNPQLFFHLKVNVALIALEVQLSFAVFVSSILMIIPRDLAGKLTSAELTFVGKFIAMLRGEVVVEEEFLVEDYAAFSANKFFKMLK